MKQNTMVKKKWVWIGLILGIVSGIWTGCGYHLAGSGKLPHGVVRVFVAEPVNRTSESRLISTFSNELKSELTRRRVKMAESPQEADGVLVSEIVSLADATIVRRGETTALEKRITVLMDIKLEDPEGNVLWRGKGITSDETYAVISSDDITTSKNRQIAINELFKRMAEDVFNRLSADF